MVLIACDGRPTTLQKSCGGKVKICSLSNRCESAIFFFFFNSFSIFLLLLLLLLLCLLSAGRGKGWLTEEDFERNEKQASKA